jgi:hypothetical protein
MVRQEQILVSHNKFWMFFRDRDWRIWLGIVITSFWITGGIWYVSVINSADPTQTHSMDAVGSFLEGAFAPLAFLWLVLGLFIQQRELADNTEVMRRTVEQSEMQTQAIAATEMNARQETFFKIAEDVKLQLGGISGMLFVSGLGPVGSGRFDREKMDGLFSKASRGDSSLFARQFLSLDFEAEGGLATLLYGTEVRRRHAGNYRKTFERLCRLASNCDVDGIIEDSLMQSGLGLLYQRMLENAPDAESATQDAGDLH